MKRISKLTEEIPGNVITVLIAEGNNSVREALHNGLKRYNYHVISAKDTSEANVMLEHEKVHVLITDLILRQGSGFDLLRWVQERRREKGGFPYVIVVTGADTPENESQAAELGADEFIPKPVTIQEIAQRLGAFNRTLQQSDSGLQRTQSE